MTASSHEHEQEILRWRQSRVARLTGPDGWLSVVGLAWLRDGPNTVGSAPGNQVLLPRGPSRIGTITVEAGSVSATFEAEAGVTHDGVPVTTLSLQDDLTGHPTELRTGSLTFYVIRRVDQLAIRVKDAESTARRSFTRIDYFPIDPRWRREARFESNDPPGTAHVPTVLGKDETYRVPGALVFELDGVTHRIDAFLEEGETDLFIVFGDHTNRSETYGGGRYLHTRPPEDQRVVIDFNKAYNPPCVFTQFATCALPPPQNKLPIRIEAGEKLYRGRAAFPAVVPRG